MRHHLAAAVGVLLIAAVTAAGLEMWDAPPARTAVAGSPPAASTLDDIGLRSTGLAAAVGGGTPTDASPAAAQVGAPGAPTATAARATGAARTSTPEQFNVERPQPRIESALGRHLATAAPAERLTVFVHAADAAFARQAATTAGLDVIADFPKVGVVAAAGVPAEIRSLTTVRGVSYLQSNRPVEYFQNTSHVASRGEEARQGFSVTYEEPQPDKPAEAKRVCTTRKNRRGRRYRSCRTVVTKSEPQPPITRTLTSPGVDGSGVSIAIIDSGVDGSHPMFQKDGKSRVVKNLKFVVPPCLVTECTEPKKAPDQYFVSVSDSDTISLGGHGTHVAGIAAGGDVVTSDGHRLHGAAPGANIVALGMGATPLHLLLPDVAINWVLEHHADPCAGACPPIKVVNNSYGGPGEFDPEDVTAKLQRALVHEGVVMVWANGNGDTLNVGGDGSDNRSNVPAQDPTPGILSVANYDDGGASNRDNVLDSSSSRGQKGRPLTYPDISAPGSEILSACRAQLAVCRGAASGTRDPNYGTIGGTSMAAPHVAGIVAQLFQANPSLTPGDVEDALEDTARPFAFGGSYEPDVTNDGITSFDKGHGLVDAVGAVARARMFHVFPAGTTACGVDAPVTVDGPGDATDAASAEATPLPSEPALDVLEGRVQWNSAEQSVQFRIKVKDLADRASTNATNGESFNFFFTHHGLEHRVNASRDVTGAQTFTVTGAPATAPKPSGGFDPATDTITVKVPAVALATATVPAPKDGTALQNLYVWSRRSLGPGAPVTDRTAAHCPYTLGLGAVPPPAGTTTGPDPAPYTPPPSEATLTPGGAPYTWSAGPFLTASVPGAFGNECGDVAVAASEPCDSRGVTLAVPEGGATIEILVTPSNAAGDFDVHLYGPGGQQVASAGGTPILDSATSSEKISVRVTASGVYRIDVVAYLTAGQSFKGEAKLR